MPNNSDTIQPILHNLSQLNTRMDSLQTFISQSIKSHTLLTHHQMTTLSNEIVTATRNVITNAAAILAASETVSSPTLDSSKLHDGETVVELDAVELLATHLHFCEVCGKGFTRDANLRMHMRAHGDEFKTPEALAKKACGDTRFKATRFSCPFEGCNRNRLHKKFRPLKSVLCLRNHFKRSHCPKTLSCDRCRKKSFAVLSDFKSHVKQCRGESTWKCSCGTTFSRKEKLFGHVALFEGHLPALEEDKEKEVMKESDDCVDELPEGFFDGLDEFEFEFGFGFGSFQNNSLQEEPWDFSHS
ncbi:protein SENSITIVE TO PROTON RHIZOTOXICITY 1-like [Abrus precatorius]|uniref:Protein SENSITIVE TO PROTON RHIZOTOXICITY 1-like n=1 Tax=Abrus precatorius TaxID=3816 RepID=A0A8B8M9J2_ABRPR|nr:protein SENSITIVE TO PROTON RHIZOTOXICITY 1-like [Abrus precatorius]